MTGVGSYEIQASRPAKAMTIRTTIRSRGRFIGWNAPCQKWVCALMTPERRDCYTHSSGTRRHYHDLAINAEIQLPAIREEDSLAVARPAWLGGASLGIGKQAYVRAVRVHDMDLVVGPAVRGKRDLRAVGRPRRPSVEGHVVGEILVSCSVSVGDKDFRIHVADHAAKDDLRSVRRPRRIRV